MKKYLTCKKDIPEDIFKIGEKYEILYENNKWHTKIAYGILDHSIIHYFISNNHEGVIGKWFSSNKTSNIYIYDYFYTDKELRKQKMQNLNIVATTI
jgi:hypothetical protein